MNRKYRRFSVFRSGLATFKLCRISFVILFLFVLLIPSFSCANNIRENSAWQFDSSADRVNKGYLSDLIEKHNAGMYTNTYINQTTNYYISDDYIDCNMTSQSIGNQGTISQDAPVASPSIGVNPGVSSASSGNSGTSTISEGGNTSSPGLTSQTGDDNSVTNESSAGSSNSVSNTQSNDDSSQTSTASDNTFDTAISDLSSSGGDASVALNSDQALSDSPVSSSIAQSSACDFNSVSGSIDSPINSGGAE